jgi:hypothetical protein
VESIELLPFIGKRLFFLQMQISARAPAALRHGMAFRLRRLKTLANPPFSLASNETKREFYN